MDEQDGQDRCGDDAGLTLLELIVSMSVFGGVMLMVFSVLLAVQQDTVTVGNRENALTVSRQAVAQIDRQVRSGNVLFAPGNEAETVVNGTVGCTMPTASQLPSVPVAQLKNFGNCMRIYTQSNGANRCVQWQVVPDPDSPGTTRLQTRSWSPGLSAAAPWTVVVRGLASRHDPAAATSAEPTLWPFRLQGAESAYHSRLVDVQLTVQVTGSTRTEQVATSLSGRNTFYGYDPNTCNPVPPTS